MTSNCWAISITSTAIPGQFGIAGSKALTIAFSAPRHTTKLENTEPLRGAGALERTVYARHGHELMG
jgi:hypothetical protein